MIIKLFTVNGWTLREHTSRYDHTRFTLKGPEMSEIWFCYAGKIPSEVPSSIRKAMQPYLLAYMKLTQ